MYFGRAESRNQMMLSKEYCKFEFEAAAMTA